MTKRQRRYAKKTAPKKGTKKTPKKPRYKVKVSTHRDVDLKRGDFKVVSYNLSKEKNPARQSQAIVDKRSKELQHLSKRGVPKRAVVILKIKKPKGERGFYYVSRSTPPDMFPTTSKIKRFAKQSINDYYKQMRKIIKDPKKKYSSNAQVYRVHSASIRFIYPNQ